jgi:hypothetical protein
MARAWAPAAAVTAFAVLLLLLQAAWSARDKARTAAVAAKAEAGVALAQGALASAAAKSVQAAQTRELTVTVQAREASHEIAEAEGGDAAVPSDVLALWAGAIDRLRVDSAVHAHRTDDSRGREPARALPAPAATSGAERG